MKQLLDIIVRAETFLREKGVERPRREAEEVIADALGLRRIDLYLQFERPLIQEELERLRVVIQRRGRREPRAYIAGFVEFLDLKLKVTPDVLIPRPETEILVDKIYQTLKGEELKGKVLWDLCTGSGCIGLALKSKLPELTVVLSDVSEPALKIAQCNSIGFDVSHRLGDLFAPFKSEQCDFFVCNPPYVTSDEYADLSPEVRDHEPPLALIGGLSIYERIARELLPHLALNGRGWLELGNGQGSSVKKIFDALGYKTHVEPDWAGHDRFFFLERD